MHSQITYDRGIWKEKYWIVTRSRKLLFWKFVPEKREEANNSMTNQRRYLLGLKVCHLFPNWKWRGLSLPTDCRGRGVFGPHLSGWYEQDMNLLFFVVANWVPLSGAPRGGQEMTLMFVGGSNRGTLGGYLRGSTSPFPCCLNPSSLDFWPLVFLQLWYH